MFYSGKPDKILLKLLVTTLLRRTGYILDEVVEILPQNEVKSTPDFIFLFSKYQTL
jgi:hypothetical protein